MPTPFSDVLVLYPGGYPLHLDMPEHAVAGAATGMRFTLPPRGLNLPLKHDRESKLVVALAGRLQVRSGNQVLATLDPGTAVVIGAGMAHRIAQVGEGDSVVGVLLWPGAVEHAFRAVAAGMGAKWHGAAIKAILARYGVEWDRGAPLAAGTALAPQPLAQALGALPVPVREAASAHLAHWLHWPAHAA